jgi:hypothetical protein
MKRVTDVTREAMGEYGEKRGAWEGGETINLSAISLLGSCRGHQYLRERVITSQPKIALTDGSGQMASPQCRRFHPSVSVTALHGVGFGVTWMGRLITRHPIPLKSQIPQSMRPASGVYIAKHKTSQTSLHTLPKILHW